MIKGSLLVISLCWLKELFGEKVSSRHLQLLLLWRQSMWRVIRLLVMQYGCGTSF